MTAWFACSEPERPTDPHVRWHHGCPGCSTKANAVMRMYPDDPTVQRVLPAYTIKETQ